MKRHHFLLLFLLLPFTYQCKETCHELPSLSGTKESFIVIDSLSGANLLHETNENDNDFDIESIDIYNADNKKVNNIMGFYPTSSTGEYGYVAEFEFLSSVTGVENPYEPDSSVFLINWNSVDSDTISVVYNFEPGKNECNWKTNRYDLFFNGKIVETKKSGPNAGSYILLK